MRKWTVLVACVGLFGGWVRPLVAGPVDDAGRWLAQLNAEEKRQAVRKWGDSERRHVNWTPGVRDGLPLKAMRPEVVDAFWTFLRGALSPEGYAAVQGVVRREAVLQRIQQAPDFRDPGKYYAAVFGEPGSGPWTVRLEGHHLSVNLTYLGDRLLSGTPFFLGANPDPCDEIDEPRALLVPLLEKADGVARRVGPDLVRTGVSIASLRPDDQRAVREIFDFYYAAFPEEVREGLTAGLDARLRAGTFRYDESGVVVEGAGLHFYLQRQSENHFHSLLRDERLDFGPSRAGAQ